MEHDISLHLPLWLAAPAVLLCLALGAYMSAAETAVTGASRPRMHRLAQQGNKRAKLVNRLLDRKDEAVSAVAARQQRGEHPVGLAHHGGADRRSSAPRAWSMPRSSSASWS